ncbi:Dopamine beta-hydroxylase-like [Arapaima gigas]
MFRVCSSRVGHVLQRKDKRRSACTGHARTELGNERTSTRCRRETESENRVLRCPGVRRGSTSHQRGVFLAIPQRTSVRRTQRQSSSCGRSLTHGSRLTKGDTNLNKGMRFLSRSLSLQDMTLMYLTTLATLVVILMASYQAGSAADSRFPYRILLDPRGDLMLSWNVSYPQQELYLELRVSHLRYGVVLGMSDRGEVFNADLIILWNDGQKSYFGVRANLLAFKPAYEVCRKCQNLIFLSETSSIC